MAWRGPSRGPVRGAGGWGAARECLLSPPSGLVLRAAAEVMRQEFLRRGVEDHPVLRLGEAVALVGEEQVLVLNPGLLERGDDLLRLGLLDPGVIGALRDQQRNRDLAGPR